MVYFNKKGEKEMYFIIVIGIVFLDIWTKYMICQKVKKGQKIEIVKKRLFLWHIKNKGAAYNSFEGHIREIKVVSSMGIAYCVFQLIKGKNKIGYALVLGGAIGNFIERVKYGAVTDFLFWNFPCEIKHSLLKKLQTNKPIFNIADIFILLGAFIIVLPVIFQKEN